MTLVRKLSHLLICMFAGCGGQEQTTTEITVRFKEFTSEIGNKIVCPEDWTSEDQGDTWGLHGPDGAVRFIIMTFTIEGTGSPDDFARIMTGDIEERGTFEKSGPELVDFDGVAATKFSFDPREKTTPSAWRLYLLQRGKYYHAIIIEATASAMSSNEGAYEEFARSFKGIE